MVMFNNGLVTGIDGYSVTSAGVTRTKKTHSSPCQEEFHEVAPLVVYQYNVVDIGKIDKLIKRKADKLNNTIYNTNEDSDVEMDDEQDI